MECLSGEFGVIPVFLKIKGFKHPAIEKLTSLCTYDLWGSSVVRITNNPFPRAFEGSFLPWTVNIPHLDLRVAGTTAESPIATLIGCSVVLERRVQTDIRQVWRIRRTHKGAAKGSDRFQQFPNFWVFFPRNDLGRGMTKRMVSASSRPG